MALPQYVSWDEIDSLIVMLSDRISKSSHMFSSISTLSRGGLIPSRLLADRLGIEKIIVDPTRFSSGSLVVDDIYDTGETFEKIKSKIDDPAKLIYVTLFARRGKSCPSQLIYGKKTNDAGYVVFPWDRLEFERLQK